MIRIQRIIKNYALETQVENRLPEFVQNVLKTLAGESNLLIKGGLARLCLLETLNFTRRLVDQERLAIERQTTDLDLVFLYHHSLIKDKNYLCQRFDKLQQYLAGEINIYLKGEDVRAIKGAVDLPTIKKIASTTADLTINECLLAPFGGQWKIFYTPQAKRDLIKGVGFLDPQDGHIRYSWGRVLPSPLGWVRMIKFVCQEKVRQLYLPPWWVTDHLKEAERMSNEVYDSSGLILGLYGLSLMEKYGKDNPQFQRRAAKILNTLGFSPTRDPQEFVEMQKQNLINQGKEFTLNELTFGEALENVIKKQSSRQQQRQNRNINKQQCNHQWQEWICDGCAYHCSLHSCLLCRASATNDLPCNKRIEDADWLSDKDSLWSPKF